MIYGVAMLTHILHPLRWYRSHRDALIADYKQLGYAQGHHDGLARGYADGRADTATLVTRAYEEYRRHIADRDRDHEWGLEVVGLFALVHHLIDTGQVGEIRAKAILTSSFNASTEGQFREGVAKAVNRCPEAQWSLQLRGALAATGPVADPVAGLVGTGAMAVGSRPISSTTAVEVDRLGPDIERIRTEPIEIPATASVVDRAMP